MIVRISAKPVISITSMTVPQTPVSYMDPILFIFFCAPSRTRRPADEM